MSTMTPQEPRASRDPDRTCSHFGEAPHRQASCPVCQAIDHAQALRAMAAGELEDDEIATMLGKAAVWLETMPAMLVVSGWPGFSREQRKG